MTETPEQSEMSRQYAEDLKIIVEESLFVCLFLRSNIDFSGKHKK